MGIMDALFHTASFAKLIRAGGIDAARVDYDQASGKLYVSYSRRGKIEFVEIPCGVTLSPEQIADLLKEPAPGEIPAAAADTSP
jgi:hypothetical protein